MNEPRPNQRIQQSAASLGEIFLKGTARLIDVQAAAARSILRSQARTAALFGAPDWSGLYGGESERQLRELFSVGTEQALNFVRQTNETIRSVQDAVGNAVAQQTQCLTEELRSSGEQLGQYLEQGADEARRTAQHAAGVIQTAAGGGLEGARASRTA